MHTRTLRAGRCRVSGQAEWGPKQPSLKSQARVCELQAGMVQRRGGWTQAPSAHHSGSSVLSTTQAGAQLQCFQLQFHIYVLEEFFGANVRWEHVVCRVPYTATAKALASWSLWFVHVDLTWSVLQKSTRTFNSIFWSSMSLFSGFSFQRLSFPSNLPGFCTSPGEKWLS